MLSALWQDLTHGARMLRKNPAFAAIAIASIGVGVGANAAMFSLADGLLLRPLGVPRAREVVSVVGTAPERSFAPPGISYPDFVDLRQRTATFEALVAYSDFLAAFDARADQPALRTLGTAVSANLFDAMGVHPAVGRFFLPEEDRVPGRDAVIVLDHRTWTERFGADPDIIGRRIRVAALDFTVIGVAPPAFKGLAMDVWPAFYVPLAMVQQVTRPPTEVLTQRDIRTLDVKGRLKPGTSLEQARTDVARVGTELAREYPDSNRSQRLTVRSELELRMANPDSMLVLMLLTLAGMVLLVASANVAGLLSSRAPERARELAMRLAIGAKRQRLVSQLLTESLIVAAGGAVVGLAIAFGAVLLFRQIELPAEIPLKLSFELNQRVLVVGLIVSTVSAIVSSLLPAWRATRTDVVKTLKGVGTQAGRRRLWGRQTIVCAQVALTLILLTVTAALYAGFDARLQQGPGYRTRGLLLARFDTTLAGYGGIQSREFFRRLDEQARGLAGVTSAALMSLVPMKTDTLQVRRVSPEGAGLSPDAVDVRVLLSRVDDDFFSTLEIPIVAGRPFSAIDREHTSRVVIVNHAFAERHWPGQSAVGKRLRMRPFDVNPGAFEVVGVAATSKYTWMGESPQDLIYLPASQGEAFEYTLVVATDGDAASLAPAVRELARSLDPHIPAFGVRTMQDLYDSRGIRVTSVIVRIVGAMSGMGLLLALVGLYGLVSSGVSSRTREIGVRIAVGARPASVVAMVMRHGLLLGTMGLAIGAAASVGAARLVEGAIPGVGRFGPEIYAAVIPLVLLVTIAAALGPARRASRIQPLQALRAD